MKKIISLSVILGIASVAFIGCAHKTDNCANSYTDENYKTMSQDCKQKCKNNNLSKASVTTPKPIENIEVQTVVQEVPKDAPILKKNKTLRISVIGQGVAPTTTASPAQAYALAKRAAVADSYRLIAEKVKGVYVEGDDLIQNMMVKRSTIRTSVTAMVKNANVIETNFKEGLCEVEMEIVLSHTQFGH